MFLDNPLLFYQDTQLSLSQLEILTFKSQSRVTSSNSIYKFYYVILEMCVKCARNAEIGNQEHCGFYFLEFAFKKTIGQKCFSLINTGTSWGEAQKKDIFTVF